MSTATADRLRPLVAPVVSAAGLDLEDIEVTPAGRRRLVRVAVDKDGGVSLDDVALVSRALSDVLDQSDVMGAQPYVLEVGSPGIDRPLVEPRHWRRAVGHLVELHLTSGDRVTGRVTAADEDGVELKVQAALKAKAGEPLQARRIAYSEVRTARVQVEFARQEDSGGAEGAGAVSDGVDEDLAAHNADEVE